MTGDADVLVAGSGAAGLTAALAAVSAGARVVLAERAAQLGGTTALSFGRVWVPGNEHAPDDGPGAARAYLDGVYGRSYPHMTEAFIAAAPAMARFAEDRSPLRFMPCGGYPDYHPARPGASPGGRALDIKPVVLGELVPLACAVRIPPGYLPMTHADWEQWRYPSRFDWAELSRRRRAGVLAGGAALAAALLDGAVKSGVRVLTGTRLTGVRLGPDGSVAAAILERGGRGAEVPARAVILATGGFDRNAELRARMLPPPVAATGAVPGNTGDALRIAASLGAAAENTAEAWWMPMVTVPGESLDGEPYFRSLIRERALPRQIVVNAAGRRFADEALPYHEFVKAMNHRDPGGGYPDGTAWMILDQGYLRAFPIPGGSREALVQAGSIPALAGAIQVDAATLAGTVARWNECCAAGADPDFGRGADAYERYMGDPDTSPNPNLGPLDQPPYYAIRVLPGTIGTKGGPVTDARGRVLTTAGDPIGGLYAAGNAASFWTGDGYPGPGATLGAAMTTGYLAGRDAGALPVSQA